MHTKKFCKYCRIPASVLVLGIFVFSLRLFAQPGVSTVESVDWNSNGTKLALGHNTGLVEIINVATGQLIQHFQVTPVAAGVIIDVTWHPQNSDVLAVASSQSGYVGGISILNTASGQDVLFLSNSWEEPVIRIAWKPDGSRIAGAIGSDGPPSFSRYIVIWDTTTGQESSRIQTTSDTILSIDWSPDGSRIAAGLGDNNVLIWDADTGAIVSTLVGHTGGSYSIAWSPDGSKLATASDIIDRTIRIWDPTSGQNLLTIPDSGAFAISWSPDGTRIAATRIIDGIHVWDTSTGELVEAVPQTASIYAVAWSPNGVVLALGDSSGAVATLAAPPTYTPTATDTPTLTPSYTPTPTSTPSPTATPFGGGGAIVFECGDVCIADGYNTFVTYGTQPRIGPGNRIALAQAFPSAIVLFDTDDGSSVTVASGTGTFSEPALSPDGSKVVYAFKPAGTNQKYVIRRINADGSGLQTLTSTAYNSRRPDWSPDGTKIVFTTDNGGDSEIAVMNADGSGLTALTANTASDSDPRWSPDGAQIAFSSTRDGNPETVPDERERDGHRAADK